MRKKLGKASVIISCMITLATTLPTSAQTEIDTGACGYGDASLYILEYDQILPASIFFKSLQTLLPADPEKKLTSISGQLELTTTFFDTNNRAALNNNAQISLTTNHRLPGYRENRESVTVKKGEKSLSYTTKNYTQKENSDDKHKLIGRISRKQRPDFYRELQNAGINNPLEVREVLRVETDSVTRQYQFLGDPVATVSIKSHEISNFGLPTRLSTFEIRRIGKARNLSQIEEKTLNSRLCAIEQEIKKQIPGIRKITTGEYQLYTEKAQETLPTHLLFSSTPWLFKLGQIVILSIIGFLLIYLINGRHQANRQHRVTTTHRSLL